MDHVNGEVKEVFVVVCDGVSVTSRPSFGAIAGAGPCSASSMSKRFGSQGSRSGEVNGVVVSKWACNGEVEVPRALSVLKETGDVDKICMPP